MRSLVFAIFLLPTLLLAGAAQGQSTPDAASPLTGTAWQWHEFQSSNDTIVTPAGDQLDLLVFRPDGVVEIATACATGEGAWVDTADGLDIDLTDLDEADCAEDSATALLLRDLDMSTSYVLEDGDLFIALPMDGGIHQFTPSLAGITWSWVEFQSSDDSIVTPGTDETHQVSFGADGVVTIETPCASGTGTFSDTADGLAIDLAAVDASDCAEDSPTTVLLRDLDMATSYVIQHGHLWIALPMDSGIHQFEPIWPEDVAA